MCGEKPERDWWLALAAAGPELQPLGHVDSAAPAIVLGPPGGQTDGGNAGVIAGIRCAIALLAHSWLAEWPSTKLPNHSTTGDVGLDSWIRSMA